MKIVIVAFDKFTDIDVFLPWDILNRARLINKNLQVKIVGTKSSHKSICGIDLPMQGDISECNEADVVFFASGAGTRGLIEDPEYLKKFSLNPENQIVCSMCSGSLILAALGLLNGLTATTYPTAKEKLESYGVEVVDEPIVIHNNIATAAGCLAAIDLSGWILERLLGKEVSDEAIASIKPVGQGLECIY